MGKRPFEQHKTKKDHDWMRPANSAETLMITNDATSQQLKKTTQPHMIQVGGSRACSSFVKANQYVSSADVISDPVKH